MPSSVRRIFKGKFYDLLQVVMPRASSENVGGGGGGGDCPTSFFSSLKKFPQFFIYGLGYILVHHQPLWQAIKWSNQAREKKTDPKGGVWASVTPPAQTGVLKWHQSVLLLIEDHTLRC